MVILKKCGLWFLTLACLFSVVVLTSSSSVGAVNCEYADDYDLCMEYQRNMNQKQDESDSYRRTAKSIGELIAQLSNEIAALNADIAANEQRVKELNVEIEKTQKELEEQQNALADILVKMHFDGNSEPITILAGSSSISDLAEKQAREEVVKREIAASSEKVKSMKKELEDKKADVERKIKLNEESRSVIALKKSTQEQLRAEAEQKADEAESAAGDWQDKIDNLNFHFPSTSDSNEFGIRDWSRGDGGYNNWVSGYFGYSCPGALDGWQQWQGGLTCECAGYVGWRFAEAYGISSISWGTYAFQYVNADLYSNVTVDSIPSRGSIAVQPVGPYAPVGHVMWVENVHDDGTIDVTEYNVTWPEGGCYAGGFCSRDYVGTNGFQFIHAN